MNSAIITTPNNALAMDGIFICFSIIIMTFLCYLMTPNNPEPQRTVPAMFYRATSRFAEGYTIPSSNDINTWYKLCNIPFRNYQSGAIGVRIYMTQDYNSLCSPYAANNSGTMEFDLNIDEDIMAVQRQKVLNTNGNICWINKKIITFEIDSGILYISNMSRPIHANYTIMFY